MAAAAAAAGGGGAWLDRFFAAYFNARPVDATYVGVPGHDHRLPDLSADGVAATVGEMRSLLEESEAEPEPAGFVERTDRRLAQGFLRIQLWEFSSRWMLGNPSFVVSEATFGMLSLLQHLHDELTRGERIAALRSRMLATPAYLHTAAEVHLDASTVPRAWVEKALTECGAALSFLREGVLCLPEDVSAEAAVAAAGFEAYEAALQGVLAEGAQEFVGCGTEAFERYMQEGHCLGMTGDEIVAHARSELEAASAWMSAPEPASAATGGLTTLHPSVDGYVDRYGEVWDEMKSLVEEKQLLTWPDFPIEYEPYPDWSRSSVTRLYFLHYRTPKTLASPRVHKYMVTPIEPTMPEQQRSELLATNNDYVIKTNHVVHHGGVGHHVQNWHAPRSPMRVGRVAHIDVASRIAFFCGGTMAEGWACYATDLIAEAGGLTELELLNHRRSRVRMCARAIVDVELHNQRMTLDEAAEFYHESSGMAAAGAQGEALKNSMFPGAAMMYLIGTDLIHKLRADLTASSAAASSSFSLRGFHDAFLSYGSIPVKLISDEMRRRAAAGLPLGAHEDETAAPAAVASL